MSTTIETLKNSNGTMLALAAVAFLITAVLVFFIIRMLVGGRLRMPGGRARQARLGIVDAFDLDRQRQLILVRRDNTEHLIMIGGPNDLLIESEIVRIEARDLRRDKAPDFTTATGDGRIPAPFAPQAERLETVGQAADPAQLSLAIPPEPLAPVPSPVATPKPDAPPFNVGAPSEPAAQRTPTFPLPPRRPPPLERRVPPRPPETGRPDAPAATDAPPRPIVEVPSEPRIDAPVAITAPSPAEPPLVAPPPATPRATPPSFLKPLPPRPPIRPLVRSNPRPATGGEPGQQSPIPAPSVAPPPAPAPTMPPIAEVPPVAPRPSVPEPDVPPAEPKDALESLEEEMAKLLGRGPGA